MLCTPYLRENARIYHKICPGLFFSDTNFTNDIVGKNGESLSYDDEYPYGRGSYGVADTIEQIIDSEYVSLGRGDFCLRVSIITKSGCPSWRWHKWGEYIGDRISVAECLGDEPDINYVLVYQIVRLPEAFQTGEKTDIETALEKAREFDKGLNTE